MKIRDLNISARARGCLLGAGYVEIEELAEFSDDDLLAIRNLNSKCVKEIRSAIDAISYIIDDDDLGIDIDANGENGVDAEVMKIEISDLGLSLRSYNCLNRAGIRTLGDLCERTPEDMMKVRNLGRKSLEEVLSKMQEYGVHLKESPVEDEEPGDAYSAIMDANIDEMELSIRSYNCLKRAGINTIGELCDRTVEDMMKVRNLGRRSFEEVLAKLAELGLSLKNSDGQDEDEQQRAAEEARRRKEEEERRVAEEALRRKEEEERKAAEEARRRKEEEERKAAEEARRRKEEEERKVAEEARRRREEEERKAAEEARRRKEEEKRKAAEEARRRKEEEERKAAEEARRRKEEEERKAAEEARRRKEEEERKAAEEARRRKEEEEQKAAEERLQKQALTEITLVLKRIYLKGQCEIENFICILKEINGLKQKAVIEEKRLKEEEERKAAEEALKRFEEDHERWEQECASVKLQLEAYIERRLTEEETELMTKASQRRDAVIVSANAIIKEQIERKSQAEKTLASLSVFRFGEKKNQKAIIEDANKRIDEANGRIAKAEAAYTAEVAMIPGKVETMNESIHNEALRQFVMPEEPKRPVA